MDVEVLVQEIDEVGHGPNAGNKVMPFVCAKLKDLRSTDALVEIVSVSPEKADTSLGPLFTLEERCVPLQSIRLPPSTPCSQADVDRVLEERGSPCDVLLPCSWHSKMYVWLPCLMVERKDGFAIVRPQPASHNAQYNLQREIVPIEQIRPVNANPTLSPMDIVQRNIDVDDMYHHVCLDPEAHITLQKKAGVLSIKYVPEKPRHLVVFALSEDALNRATLVAEIHLRGLMQRAQIKRRLDECQLRMTSLSQGPGAQEAGIVEAKFPDDPQAPFSATFAVPDHLIGLAIGSAGRNIQQVRQIPGVANVELDGCTFHVTGTTAASVQQGRALLEFGEDSYLVKVCFMSRLIGRQGKNIQEIIDKTGLHRLHVQGDDSQEAPPRGMARLLFTGTLDAIQRAKLILDFNIDNFTEMDRLAAEQEELAGKLRTMTVTPQDDEWSGAHQNGGRPRRGPNYFGGHSDAPKRYSNGGDGNRPPRQENGGGRPQSNRGPRGGRGKPAQGYSTDTSDMASIASGGQQHRNGLNNGSMAPPPPPYQNGVSGGGRSSGRRMNGNRRGETPKEDTGADSMPHPKFKQTETTHKPQPTSHTPASNQSSSVPGGVPSTNGGGATGGSSKRRNKNKRGGGDTQKMRNSDSGRGTETVEA